MLKNLDTIKNLLSSQLKVTLCFILDEKGKSLSEIIIDYDKKFKQKKNRETIYRALESMVGSNFLEKKYDPTNKKLIYLFKLKKIELDFVQKEINII